MTCRREPGNNRTLPQHNVKSIGFGTNSQIFLAVLVTMSSCSSNARLYCPPSDAGRSRPLSKSSTRSPGNNSGECWKKNRSLASGNCKVERSM